MEVDDGGIYLSGFGGYFAGLIFQSVAIIVIYEYIEVLFKMTHDRANEKDWGDEKIEDVGHPALNDLDYDEEYSPREQRKIIRRIDRRLVTITGLSYCISLMDRTNLSMAAVAG